MNAVCEPVLIYGKKSNGGAIATVLQSSNDSLEGGGVLFIRLLCRCLRCATKSLILLKGAFNRSGSCLIIREFIDELVP